MSGPVTMSPTDEELDRDWQPNGRRPQSTIARSFSAELMDIFRIENSVADLDEQLNKRKEKVTSHTTELEALEKRIKEMEARLKRSSGQGQGTATQSESQRQAASDLAADKNTAAQMASAQRSMGTSRPGTAKQPQQAPAHGGAMPPTPTASEGEYELVDPSTAFAFPQPHHYGSNGLATQSFTDMVLVYKDGDRDS